MKKTLFALTAFAAVSLNMAAQPPADSTPKYPQGATYTHSSGTQTITGDYTSSTQYYNVIQCTGGTLTMNGCTVTKTGDGSGGDNSSFYGNNSSIYCGAASSSNYESTTAASGAKIVIQNVTVNGSAQGANAVIATNGATVEIDGITIVNDKSVSRGLHATYGGIITASNVDITTNEATSSTIATDRGGGTVTVNGGTATANGAKSAVIYSTGVMSATNLVGTSAQGEIAVIEGDNSISMTNCTMTSGSSERGLLMMQSGSGDASGVNPVMTITGTSLTMTDSSAPLLEVATCVTATCTLDNCTVSVPSGILMYVMADSQWSTSGAVGNLILSNGSYSGIVKYDTGYTANVTVNEGAVWILTGNASVSSLVNNGTIITNGYTLTAASSTGSGTQVATATQSLTIGDLGYATLCSPYPLDLSTTGLEAYTASFGTEGTITLSSALTTIPAATPVIVKGDAGTYTIPMAASASSVSDNDLLGTLTSLTTSSDYAYYALTKISDSTVGFGLVGTGVAIPANKAYYRTTASSSARTYYTWDDATAIRSVATPAATSAATYNLQGVQMRQPVKGIAIREGKKVIIK